MDASTTIPIEKAKPAKDITFILDELFMNKEVTEEKYGGRSGTGSYSFMIKGNGEVMSLNTASRVGTLSIKLKKSYDSESVTFCEKQRDHQSNAWSLYRL